MGFAIGQVCALPVALALAARSPLLRWPAATYTFLVRGSPLLVQLFIVYYGLAQFPAVRASIVWPILRDPFDCAVLTIGLNSAAYMAVIVAGGLRRLPAGQTEACISLGLSRRSRLTHVLLPQVYRAIFPSIGNELVLVLKASSLASAVTVMEMSGAARSFTARTYAPFEVFTVAGFLYLAVGLLFAVAARLVERRWPGAEPVRRRSRPKRRGAATLGAAR